MFSIQVLDYFYLIPLSVLNFILELNDYNNGGNKINGFVHHYNGGKDDEVMMTDGTNVRPSKLTGLELAKHVLIRLVDNHEGIERVAKDFDNDTSFILGIIDFLKDIKWLEQDLTSGLYQITEKGRIKVKS